MSKQPNNGSPGPASELKQQPQPSGATRTGDNAGDDRDVQKAREKITEHMKDKEEAADIALAAVDELADRATEVESLKSELESTREQLLRKVAEFQNYRRRTEQEKAGLVAFGQSQVIQQLLDVLDDFERSLGAAEQLEQQASQPSPAYETLRQGVEMIYRKFVNELKRLGVEPIEAVGKPFSEREHEAMMQRPAPEGTPAGIVLDELQKGYRMGDRVLRHSKVVVSS